MADRKSKTHEAECNTCGKVELLKYPTYWHRVNKGNGDCRSCASKKKTDSHFSKGHVPHNKGVKGFGQWFKWSAPGDRNPAWKGGVTSKDKLFRKTPEYKAWRVSVFERDDYTCQICGIRGGSLHADHIKPFAYYKELRLDIDNGRTLCVDCHKKTDTYLSGALKHAV